MSRVPLLLPTVLGAKALLFYAVLVVAFLATPYMNLFFLLLVFLTVMGYLNVVWALRNLRAADARILDVDPAPAGAGAPVVGMLGARRRSFGLCCSVRIGRRTTPVLASTEVCGERRLEGRLPALPRGVHRIERAWLESVYPFGMLRAWRRIDAPQEVWIHPAPADLGDARTRTEALAALYGSARSAGGDAQPSGLRDFRPGDEPRDVDWRATARRDRLVAREWEADGLEGFEICLDRRAAPADFEMALSWIAALARWAQQHKEVVLLHSQGHTASYGEGHRSWNELMRYLAMVAPLPADGPPPPVTAPGVIRLPTGRGTGVEVHA